MQTHGAVTEVSDSPSWTAEKNLTHAFISKRTPNLPQFVSASAWVVKNTKNQPREVRKFTGPFRRGGNQIYKTPLGAMIFQKTARE